MKTNRISYLFDCDAYKVSHYLQYPTGTTSMFSYIESRVGSLYPKTVFFGLQYYLKEYLAHRVTVNEVEIARKYLTMIGEPFNYDGWMYIARDLQGKLPVRIRAVPEGTVVPINNILCSIESTDPKVFWVASWLETSLLRAIWYPTTVATRSWRIRNIIMTALEKSSDDPAAEIDFKLNDFGARGVSSQESAMLGGAAHLVSFKGSDNIAGIFCANDYYNCEMSGFSIPASEHSSITSFGREHEVDAYRNMIKQFGKPGAMFACVSDSYDIFRSCSDLWGGVLREEVINSGATLVVRPDTGNPEEIVVQVTQRLDEKFGHTVNSKGFKVLNHVRVIQGDGITEDSIPGILENLMAHGYSMTNLALGSGGGLLQVNVNRDTNRFAMKCSSITVNGEERDVVKDPITDHGKRSKAGRLDLILEDDQLKTVRLNGGELNNSHSVMRTVYENGEILVEDTFDSIRKRAANV